MPGEVIARCRVLSSNFFKSIAHLWTYSSTAWELTSEAQLWCRMGLSLST